MPVDVVHRAETWELTPGQRAAIDELVDALARTLDDALEALGLELLSLDVGITTQQRDEVQH